MATLPITPLETALTARFPDNALETLRARFLYVVTSDHDTVESVRATVQMAYETELGVVLSKRIAIAPGIAEELVETRQRFLQIDGNLVPFRYLVDPALAAAKTLRILPASYLRFLTTYVEAPDPRYRVSSLAVLLCYAATYFGDL